MHRLRSPLTLSILLSLAAACSSSEPGPPSDMRAAAPATPPSILSAYYGLDKLPLPIVRLCPGRKSLGHDGMPVTFSVRLQSASVDAKAFAVTTASGEVVSPSCATLRPADETLENRTVLLAGVFGTPDAQPVAVEVVGEPRDVHGRSLRGLRTESITPLEEGPKLLVAERFGPNTPGLAGECPAGTKQVLQLTWEGGVTGPDGAKLADAQRQAVTVSLADGSSVTPIALADDDPDNFVHACLDTTTRAKAVAVRAGAFHDPRDDANPDTSVGVVDGS